MIFIIEKRSQAVIGKKYFNSRCPYYLLLGLSINSPYEYFEAVNRNTDNVIAKTERTKRQAIVDKYSTENLTLSNTKQKQKPQKQNRG
jgi:glycosyltransferase A (GT-A) superfamily protein (DUF2064 family)